MNVVLEKITIGVLGLLCYIDNYYTRTRLDLTLPTAPPCFDVDETNANTIEMRHKEQ